MKILFIRTTGGVSGAEMYNVYLLKALQKVRDVDVHLLTNNTPFFRKLKKERIPSSLVFHPIAEAGTNRELFLSILWFYPMLCLYLFKIKHIERGVRFDTIVLQSMTEKLFLSPFLRLLGYRVVWIEHGPLFRTNRSELVKKLYVYKSKRADAIVAVSEDTKKDLVRGGVPAEKIHVVYIGIERPIHSRYWGSFNTGNGTKNNQKTIGFLGSVTKEKGIIEFLDTAAHVGKKHTGTKYMVMGGGPHLLWAKEKAKSLGIQKSVLFTGHVDDVKKYLKQIDILYFPTHHQEGLSLAILEALSLGKIVVTRDIGGNRELVVDKKTGFLFKTDAEAEKLLDGILSGKISTKGIRESAVSRVMLLFAMDKQVLKFVDIFHG